MSTATPTWSDNVALAGTLATPQTLAHGNRVKGTLDLRGKYAGYLFLRLGRLGTNAPSSVIQILSRRVRNNGAVIHPMASVGPDHPERCAAAASTFNIQHSTFNIQHSTFNSQDSYQAYLSGPQ